ncbi:hypothetical protein T492DRAFT_851532 [Pavlovales sp. CCMP2436]|nr:hypothetical protein T492DRAFT_851532 [Pavlovales sp. CCMP2436]
MGKGAPDSLALVLSFVFWYVGNVYYNIYNSGALKAAGGKNAGLTMTISTMQLGVCSAYALLMWALRFNPIKLLGLQEPEAQKVPALTTMDLLKTLPVGICSAGAHSSSVFALGGDPLFGQIVKAGEPVIAAVVNTIFYGSAPSMTKVLCLPVIVGGVGFASLKKTVTGAYGTSLSTLLLNLMNAPGIKDRFAGVGNQFAVTEILSFLVSLPVMIYVEGAQVGPVTNSVANTAKRVIVMLVMAALPGASPLTEEQQIGAAIAIGGVMLYSLIDDLLGKKKVAAKKTN